MASNLIGAWAIVAAGGVIVGDDFSDRFQDVIRAARGFAKSKGAQLSVEGPKWWIRKR